MPRKKRRYLAARKAKAQRQIRVPLPVCPIHAETCYVGTVKKGIRFCYCPVPNCKHPGIKQVVDGERFRQEEIGAEQPR